ncbi:MAG: hypothetical protein M3Z22_00065 [Verrucomicrobiota bacterium]|nr:hypothetical protein [Verrucomicrobiota bacterium]
MKTSFFSSRSFQPLVDQAVPRRGWNWFLILGLCVAGVFLGSAHSASAQVLVTPVVTFNVGTGVYTYTYSVTNNSANTLAIISFGARPATAFTVQNRTAPMGFISTYDSGNGLVSFLEDNNPATPQTFAPGSTVSPFSFTSTFGPGATTFQALDIFGNTFTGVTQAPIPEPGVLALCALAVPMLGILLFRRKVRSATVSVS